MAETNGHNGNSTATPEKPTLETAIEQIEVIRDSVKTALHGLNTLLVTIKTAQREQKNSNKEFDSVRATLRSLQSVRI